MKIAGISDVSVGYGSSQIPAVIQSLVQHYENAVAILLEPDQPEKTPKHNSFPDFSIRRISTTFPPHTELGRIEYVTKAAKMVNDLQPDILIIFCSYSLPALLKLRFKPQFVIYYAYETASYYGTFDVKLNRQVSSLIDLAIFPEENRAVRHIEEYRYHQLRSVVVYNCANQKDGEMTSPAKRNGKILYQGTIEKDRTFAEYFLRLPLKSMPVDLFGWFGTPDSEEIKKRFTLRVGPARYCGYVDAETLAQIRRTYCYSIVMWNPTGENELYACPNKFFESIAAGVPPISAPHPQMKMLIERYKCGILMDDWSFSSFRAAVRKAMKTWRTPAYAQMVENCKRATAEELNWDAQFEKIRSFLPLHK